MQVYFYLYVVLICPAIFILSSLNKMSSSHINFIFTVCIYTQDLLLLSLASNTGNM